MPSTKKPLQEEGSSFPFILFDTENTVWTGVRTETNATWKGNPGTPGPPSTSVGSRDNSPIGVKHYRSTQGWNQDDYHEAKKAGEILDCTQFEQWSVTSNLRTSYDFTVSRDYTSGFYGATENFAVSHTPQIKDQISLAIEQAINERCSTIHEENLLQTDRMDALLQESASRIYSAGYDALTSAGELKQLIDMFVGLKSKLKRLLKNGPRSLGYLYQFQKNADLGLEVSNLWLEARYGWRVLYYDMIDLHEAIVLFDAARTRYNERVFYKENVIYEEYTSSFAPPWDSATDSFMAASLPTFQARFKYRVITKFNGFITADISPPRVASDLSITAWELLPLSFVVDWFIGVGNALSASKFHDIVEARVSGISLRTEAELISIDVIGDEPAGGFDMTRNDSVIDGTMFCHRTDRFPRQISTTPVLWPSLSDFKVLDLVALTKQLLIGRK